MGSAAPPCSVLSGSVAKSSTALMLTLGMYTALLTTRRTVRTAQVNTQRYYPVPLSMPYHNVKYNPDDPIHWKSCYGYLTNATLTPLEEHVQELNWMLSQTFGIMLFVMSEEFELGTANCACTVVWLCVNGGWGVTHHQWCLGFTLHLNLC